ncbi:hypothetical protein RIF29_03450 [Crotalaria pallida]|uniref:Protein kinase domain-containing protein n=1 Tax=Crotalaria pallida TaxID=3830 RepID=A0AAN9IZY8_CROPI
MLTGKPLFPGKNVVRQLDLMTDFLGTPPAESIARIRNEKARRYLNSMRKKQPVPLSHKFPHADPLALSMLECLLAFDPKDRPTAEEALAHPYFNDFGVSSPDASGISSWWRFNKLYVSKAGSGLVGEDDALGSGGVSATRIELSYMISLRDMDMRHVKDFTFVHGEFHEFHYL